MNRLARSVAALLACVIAADAASAPPRVTSIQPARHAVGAHAGTAVRVEFDAAVDPSSVNPISFRVFGRWSGPATGTINVTAGIVTFVPDQPFFAGEYVTVSLSKGIKNSAGESMALGYAWSFWIAAAPASLDLDYVTRFDTRRTNETWIQPYGAYAGDLDNDGWTDLAVPCEQSDDVRVYMNDGTGSYPAAFAVHHPTGMSSPSPNEPADFDHDGEIDLVVGNSGNGFATVMFGDGLGGFSSSVSLATVGPQVRGVGVLDLNGDGWDDVVTASRAGGAISLILNNGDGTFAPRVDIDIGVANETSIAVADADNDGLMDVFLGNYGSPRYVTVLLGDGNGGLVARTPVATSGQPWMLAVGDLDRDGNVDVFSSNASGNGIGIHYGDGTGGISAVTTLPTGGFPLAIDAGDIDGDGDLDLVSSDYSSASWTIWENTGPRVFANRRTLAASSAGSCATLHDRDNDGDLDLTGIDEVDDWVYLFENNPPPVAVPALPVAAVTMAQNHPNPFNPSTTIRFELAQPGFVNLSVYDASGALITTIADARYQAGPHEVRWNGTGAAGERVASGLYFYRLTANGTTLTRKMMLLK